MNRYSLEHALDLAENHRMMTIVNIFGMLAKDITQF